MHGFWGPSWVLVNYGMTPRNMSIDIVIGTGFVIVIVFSIDIVIDYLYRYRYHCHYRRNLRSRGFV